MLSRALRMLIIKLPEKFHWHWSNWTQGVLPSPII